MSRVITTQAYATTDGRLFSTPEEAQAHQHSLDIRKEVHAFFNWDGASRYFDTYAATKVGAVIDWEIAKKMQELKEKAR